MERTIKALFAFAISLLVVVIPNAYAHKQLESVGNNEFASATIIPDHQVSWAVYQELQRGDAHYYRFNANEGERFFMQITIPDLDQYRGFAPSVALIGDGLQEELPIASKRSEVTTMSAAEAEIAVPASAGDGAIVLEYDESAPAEKFFEPFTQTSYLVRQELTIEELPSTGTYTVVVYDNSVGFDSGKYVLAIGEREEFSAVDFFTTLPAAWFGTKLYFQDYLSVALAIALILGIASLPVMALWRKRLKVGPRAR